MYSTFIACCSYLIKDGSYSHANTIQFDTGTHDWQHSCIILDFGNKLIESINVLILFSEHSGTIWLDDIGVFLLREDVETLCEYIKSPPTVKIGCCKRRDSILGDLSPVW